MDNELHRLPDKFTTICHACQRGLMNFEILINSRPLLPKVWVRPRPGLVDMPPLQIVHCTRELIRVYEAQASVLVFTFVPRRNFLCKTDRVHRMQNVKKQVNLHGSVPKNLTASFKGSNDF